MLSGDSSRLSGGAGLGGGVTASVAVRVVPLMFADRVTSVRAPTLELATGKVALVAPPETTTLPGTEATAGWLLDRLSVL
jgi:hypothetical protein